MKKEDLTLAQNLELAKLATELARDEYHRLTHELALTRLHTEVRTPPLRPLGEVWRDIFRILRAEVSATAVIPESGGQDSEIGG